MGKIDKKVEELQKKLLALLIPESMPTTGYRELATEAGISYETIRKARKGKGINSDTLIRLLVARGVSPEAILNLPKNITVSRSKGEALWLGLGAELSEDELVNFADLIKHLRLKKWTVKK